MIEGLISAGASVLRTATGKLFVLDSLNSGPPHYKSGTGHYNSHEESERDR